MARKNERHELIGICGIREVQRLVAEVRTERAASRLREQERELVRQEQLQSDIAEHWCASLDEASPSPEITALWSTALLHQEERVHECESRKDKASREAERTSREFHAATARHDLARSMAQKAGKAELRRRDEERVEEALDRHAQRRHQI